MTDYGNYIGGEWTRGADAGPNINPSNLDDVIGVYAKPRHWGASFTYHFGS